MTERYLEDFAIGQAFGSGKQEPTAFCVFRRREWSVFQF